MVTLGWAHVAVKDVAAAERIFQQAIAVDRNFGESHGGLAVAYAFQRKIDLAQSEIRIATRLDPAGFGAAFAKTIVLKLQGREQAATELLARLFEQAPAAGTPTLIEQLRMYGAKQLQIAKPTAAAPKRE
jgi:Flp pilus assembly protein TadD